MQQKHPPYTDFVGGLWVVGGKEQVPKGSFRRADGINAVKTGSLRSRFGSQSVQSGSAAVGNSRFLIEFGGVYYWVTDNAGGHLYRNNVSVGTGYGTFASWLKVPPQVGDSDYLFVASNNIMQKFDSSGNATNWGIAPPVTAPTVATFSEDILQIESFDSLSGFTTTNCTVALDTGNFQEGTASIEIIVNKNIRGQIAKAETFDLNAFATAVFANSTVYTANGSEYWLGSRITDSNGNVQIATTSGTSQATGAPTWNTNIGGTTVSGTVTFTNYGPTVSSTADFICLWIGTDEPDNLEEIDLDFILNTGATDYFTYQVPLSAATFVPSQGQAAGGVTGAVGPLSTGSNSAVGGTPNNNNEYLFITTGAVQGAAPNGGALPITHPNVLAAVRDTMHVKKAPQPVSSGTVGWFQIALSKAEFSRVGNTLALDWANVIRIRIRVKANANGPAHVWVDALQMIGGVGTEGDYQCAYVFANTNTLTVSNPSPVTTINNVNRQGILWSAIGTSTDPQVNARILYRSLGGGSLLFFDAIINDNTTTTYNDITADFVGAVDGNEPEVLGNTILYPIQLQYDNTPPGTLGGASNDWPYTAGPYEGSIFWCGDPAHPGRLYYSPTGRPESVEGWIDITYEDDTMLVPFVFNGSLYVLSAGNLWIVEYIQGTDPPFFTYDKVLGAPGVNVNAPVVAIGKTMAVYQAPEGMVGFNGFSTSPVDVGIRVLFRGETAEGYQPFVAKTGAYGRGEFYFSDGANTTLILNEDTGTWRSYGLPLGSINFNTGLATIQGMKLGNAADVLNLDTPGVFTDDGTNIPIQWQPANNLLGEEVNVVVRRVVFDINTAGQNVQPILIVNDADQLPVWASGTYGAGYRVQDSNGNVQEVIIGGTTGGSAPAWENTIGGLTVDGTVTWQLMEPGLMPIPVLNSTFRQRLEYPVGLAAETFAVRMTGSLATGIVELFAIELMVEAGP